VEIQAIEELLAKLDEIEEQARLALGEFPRELRKERQRTIIALVKYMRVVVTTPGMSLVADPEATVKLRAP
jgi:hypothetical protein